MVYFIMFKFVDVNDMSLFPNIEKKVSILFKIIKQMKPNNNIFLYLWLRVLFDTALFVITTKIMKNEIVNKLEKIQIFVLSNRKSRRIVK